MVGRGPNGSSTLKEIEKLLPAILRKTQRISEESPVVLFDVGAAEYGKDTGSDSSDGILLADAFGISNVNVHAFEMQADLAGWLQRKVNALYGAAAQGHFHVHSLALGANVSAKQRICGRRNTAKLAESIRHGAECLGKDQDMAAPVAVTTLDAFVNEHNLPPPGYAKIDVEGNEWDIMLGMERLLAGTSVTGSTSNKDTGSRSMEIASFEYAWGWNSGEWAKTEDQSKIPSFKDGKTIAGRAGCYGPGPIAEGQTSYNKWYIDCVERSVLQYEKSGGTTLRMFQSRLHSLGWRTYLIHGTSPPRHSVSPTVAKLVISMIPVSGPAWWSPYYEVRQGRLPLPLQRAWCYTYDVRLLVCLMRATGLCTLQEVWPRLLLERFDCAPKRQRCRTGAAAGGGQPSDGELPKVCPNSRSIGHRGAETQGISYCTAVRLGERHRTLFLHGPLGCSMFETPHALAILSES